VARFFSFPFYKLTPERIKTTKERHTMETITKPHATLEQFIDQMRLIGKRSGQAVQIRYNSEQVIASFYIKGKLVDTRRLFRL
jgi:hypothetical protein